MTIQENYVHTIWCDDIRQEVGNKPSFMGTYTGAMLLPALPYVLPKLCAQIWVVSPIERPLNQVLLRVLRSDGEIIAEFTLVEQPIISIEGATRSQAVAAIMLGPLEIPETCRWFMVQAVADGEQLDGPKLWIQTQASQADTEAKVLTPAAQ